MRLISDRSWEKSKKSLHYLLTKVRFRTIIYKYDFIPNVSGKEQCYD